MNMDSLALFFPMLLALFFVFVIVIAVMILFVFLKTTKFDFGLETRRNYGVGSVTLRGETVKSIGEKTIADYFDRNRINYVYEQRDISGYFLPDFYLPDFNIYVEYWGLANADDEWTRNKYVRHMKRKMAIYHRNNVRFVSIYPHNIENLDWVFRTKFRQVTGYDLPN